MFDNLKTSPHNDDIGGSDRLPENQTPPQSVTFAAGVSQNPKVTDMKHSTDCRRRSRLTKHGRASRMDRLKCWDVLPAEIPNAVSEEIRWRRVTGGRFELVREVLVLDDPHRPTPRILRQLVVRVTCTGGDRWTVQSRAKQRNGVIGRDAAFGLARRFAGIQLDWQRRRAAR